MENNDNTPKIVMLEGDFIEGLSRDNVLDPKLSVIKELNRSIEKDGETNSPETTMNQASLKKSETQENEMQFEFEERDTILEKIEIVAIKLDIHKNGTLFLKELDIMLEKLQEKQRKPVADFLIYYLKSTKRASISVSVFVQNMNRAVQQNKFGIREALGSEAERFDDKDLANIIERVETISKLEIPGGMPIPQCDTFDTYCEKSTQKEKIIKKPNTTKTSPKVKNNQQPTQRKQSNYTRSNNKNNSMERFSQSNDQKGISPTKAKSSPIQDCKKFPLKSEKKESKKLLKTPTYPPQNIKTKIPLKNDDFKKDSYENKYAHKLEENKSISHSSVTSPKDHYSSYSEENSSIMAKIMKMNNINNGSANTQRNKNKSPISEPTMAISCDDIKYSHKTDSSSSLKKSNTINKSFTGNKKISNNMRNCSVQPSPKSSYNIKSKTGLQSIVKMGYSLQYEEKKMRRCASAALHRKSVPINVFAKNPEVTPLKKVLESQRKSVKVLTTPNILGTERYSTPNKYGRIIKKRMTESASKPNL